MAKANLESSQKYQNKQAESSMKASKVVQEGSDQQAQPVVILDMSRQMSDLPSVNLNRSIINDG